MANNERLIRCYVLENRELLEMIRELERGVTRVNVADLGVDLLPPPLVRQTGVYLHGPAEDIMDPAE